jgi:PTS system ascorbate-specific IIA component
MKNKLLLVTHEAIGESLLNVAKTTLDDELPLPVKTINVAADTDPESIVARIQAELDHISDDKNVLILTDLFGATPCNIAQNLKHENALKIISGLNLPMLLRVLNYPDLSLNELVEKAITGGQEGIRSCN